MSAVHLPPVQQLAISVLPDGHRVALAPAGEIDLASAGHVADAVGELRDAGFDHVVVDLRGVEFLDSVGLRMLLGVREDASRAGYRLELLPGPDQVQRVFELTGTRAVFAWA